MTPPALPPSSSESANAGLGTMPSGSVLEGPPTWSTGQLEWVDPRLLSDHLIWSETLGFEAPESEELLIESARTEKVIQPLIVTGTGCASGPDVILDGHRRRRAAMDARLPLVPVIRRTDLTAGDEETVLLKAALGSAHTRKLKPSKLAELEHRLYDLYSTGRGARNDLTCVANNGSSHRSDALAKVALEAGQPRNAVANRRKVFTSPVAPAVLKQAVDDGRISLTSAAELVRDAEGPEDVQAACRVPLPATDASADDTPLANAQKALETRVREVLQKPKRNRSKSRASGATRVDVPMNGNFMTFEIGMRRFSVRVLSPSADAAVSIEIVAGVLNASRGDAQTIAFPFPADA